MRAAVALLVLVAVRAHATPIVRGYEGQPALVLDRGASLRGAPLVRREAERRGWEVHTHGAIDKTRLDARRLLRASHLSPLDQIARLVAIVRQRMPDQSMTSYDAFAASSTTMRLSVATKRRIGICRERSFLLAAMLKEGGLRARVRYGKVYDNGEDLGGHAWVETQVDGHSVRLDPSMPSFVAVDPQTTFVHEQRLDGTTHGVHATTGDGALLYVPTHDLRYVQSH